MVSAELLEEAAHRFALLGDPTRLRILSVLHDAGELPVGELAERAGVTRENRLEGLAERARHAADFQAWLLVPTTSVLKR